MVFQVVHHYPDDARGGFVQIEIFSGRKPTPIRNGKPGADRRDKPDCCERVGCLGK